MRTPRLLIATLVLTAVAAPSAAQAATTLYPNLKALPPRNLSFDRTDVSQDSSGNLHNVLRFSNTVVNDGEGPLEIRAVVDQSLNPPSGPAVQRLYDSDGTYRDVPLGASRLYYHAVHVHYHFDHWGEYQLWTKPEYDRWIASGRADGQPDLVGQKTTSCVMDEEFVDKVPSALWPARYPAGKCMPDSRNMIAQGLSPGWGDTYDYYRFEQWIDLGQSNLADGTYVLRTVSDPLNLVYESPDKADVSRENQLDNESTTTFVVSGGRIVDSDAPTGTVTINHVDRTTSSPQVSLDVLGRDDVSGVDQFRVTTDHGSNWKLFTNTSRDSNFQTLSWDVSDPTYGGSASSGPHTVCVLFKDASGKWGPLQSDTIDYQPPPKVVSAYGRAVQADGPAGWWRLGETSGSTAANQTTGSAGAYTGGVTLGQPSLVPTDAGNTAVAFNGTNATVSIPASSALDLRSAITLEAWIKPTSLPAAGIFRSVLTKPEAYSLQFNGPRLEFTVMQSGTRRRLQAPAGAIVAGSAYQVVATFDGTTQRLYLNGTQVASAALSGAASVSTSPLHVGSWDGTGEFFVGTIDEPAVYAKVLTPAQISAHYAAATNATLDAPSGLFASASSSSQVDLRWTDNASGETGQVVERSPDSSFASPTTVSVPASAQSYSDTGLSPGATYWYRVKAVAGSTSSSYSNVVQVTTPAPTSYAALIASTHPVSYWRLGETSGTIAGDDTVTGPGTFVGSPTLGVASLVFSDQANPAVGFNGTTSDIRVGQTGAYDLTGAITLESWIKPTSVPAPGSTRTILAKPGSYALQLNGPSAAFTVVQFGVRRSVQAPAGAVRAGLVSHLVGTFDGTTERLYVNGTLVASQPLAGTADQTIGGIHIGSWDGSQEFFAGTVDDTSVHARVLSAAQVSAHFAAGKAALGEPTDASAGASSSTQVDVQWTDNATTETAMVVQRSTDAGFASPTSISLPAGTQAWSDTRLTPGTTYWYRVRAVTASDSSAWSPTVSATTLPPAAYASVVSADAPLSYWRLGEASGTAAVDQQGTNPGTYSATGATLGTPSLLAAAPGDTAVTFNRGSVRVAQRASLNLTNAITLEAWIRPANLPATGTFASVLTKPESYTLQFNGPRLEFTLVQNGARRRLQAPVGAVAAGGIYHVVGTYDGAMGRLYVNGRQVTSGALTGGASTSTADLLIGSWDGTQEFFSGTVDEVALYDSALPAASVANHFSAGTVG